MFAPESVFFSVAVLAAWGAAVVLLWGASAMP